MLLKKQNTMSNVQDIILTIQEDTCTCSLKGGGGGDALPDVCIAK